MIETSKINNIKHRNMVKEEFEDKLIDIISDYLKENNADSVISIKKSFSDENFDDVYFSLKIEILKDK